MRLQESAENYLETILILSKSGNTVRSIDIASELDFSKPSVSIAMKSLRTSGYITVDADGHIQLTDAGREVAETMYERHVCISDWLIFLGVEKEIALRDACKMEHTMSEESFAAIKKHIENWKQSVNKKN